MERVAEGVYVVGSRYWRLNTGVVMSADHALVIDAGVFPDELSALAGELRNRHIVAGIATHEHWDHILWSSELGAAVPRLASETAARCAAEHRASLIAQVEAEQDTNGVQWEHDLLARLQPIRYGEIGVPGRTAELVDLAGHSPGHAGVWVPAARVAFVGDTVSDVDPPALPGTFTGAAQYVRTLARLRELVTAADVVVPGHGTLCDSEEAHHRLDADARYLDLAITAAQSRPDTPANVLAKQVATALDDRRLSSATGWEIHLENLSDLVARPAL